MAFRRRSRKAVSGADRNHGAGHNTDIRGDDADVRRDDL